MVVLNQEIYRYLSQRKGKVYKCFLSGSLDRQKCTFCTFLTRRLLQCVQAKRALVWVNVFSIRLIGEKKRFCLFVFYFVCLKRELISL